MTMAELIAEKRRIKDAADVLNAQLADLKEKEGVVDWGLMAAMKDQGLDHDGAKCAGPGGTATWRMKPRAKYEPDKWPSIFKWCAENGYEYLIQRRTSDAKILDLIDNGVALPDGLGIEFYPQVDFRRG